MTPKHQVFVNEYLIDLNVTQAYIRAGYTARTARQHGYKLFHRPHIQAAIQAAQQARSERTKIDADWVLERLARLADATLADFLVTPDGGGMPHFDLSGATPEQLAAIEALQLDTHREKGEDGGVVEKIKLTLPGKLKTLELIGKHVDVQAFAERKEIGGIGGGPVKVEDATTTEVARRIAFLLAQAAKEYPKPGVI